MNAENRKQPCDCPNCRAREAAALAVSTEVSEGVNAILELAVRGAEHLGYGSFKMKAGRSNVKEKMAGIVICLSGPLTDDDLRGIRDYMHGVVQDISAGRRLIDNGSSPDNLGSAPEEGGAS